VKVIVVKRGDRRGPSGLAKYFFSRARRVCSGRNPGSYAEMGVQAIAPAGVRRAGNSGAVARIDAMV